MLLQRGDVRGSVCITAYQNIKWKAWVSPSKPPCSWKVYCLDRVHEDFPALAAMHSPKVRTPPIRRDLPLGYSVVVAQESAACVG